MINKSNAIYPLNQESLVLTPKEIKVINKKLQGKKLSQQDSNYLSRYVRPKLKEIVSIDAKTLLDKLGYNQKAESIENKLKKIILASLKEVDSIILYGSYVQNNYKDYNDIDILIITKKKLYDKIKEKYRDISLIKENLKKLSINSDIQIYDRLTFSESYPHSPSLIYQLKDHKVIYGRLNITDKISLYNANLHMKLDWSNIEDIEPSGEEIYNAFRNTMLVKLILNKIIDNRKLKESLINEFGKNLLEKLKNNKESVLERKIALRLLKEFSEHTRKEIKGALWEKIEL